MGYQPRPRAGKLRGFERSKRVKSKTKLKRQRRINTYLEEQKVPSLEEVVSQTLNSLHNLGNQTFAVPPFHEHFDHWLMSLQTVLTDFERSQAVTVDAKFKEESSLLLSNIKSALIDKQLVEASRAEAILSLLSLKNTLLQKEQEHSAKMKETSYREEPAIKALMEKVEALQKELDSIRHMRTGFLRGISKKTKAQKEEEATLRLQQAERSLAAEEVSLRENDDARKNEILEQIATCQRDIERLEAASQVDDSAEVRRTACKNLADAVNDLLKRMGPVSENAGPSS